MSGINITVGGMRRIFTHVENLVTAAEGRLDMALMVEDDEAGHIDEARSVLIATKAYLATFKAAGTATDAAVVAAIEAAD